MIRLLTIVSIMLAVLSCSLAEPPRMLGPDNIARDIAIPALLHWQGNPNVRYECDVARDALFTNSVLTEKRVTGTSISLSHLLPGVKYYWRVRVEGEWSAARSFTTSEKVPAAARMGRIVLAQGPKNRQIHIMNADGTGLTRLTDNLNMPSHPALSPDGRLIAFVLGADGLYGMGGLYIIQADGSGCRQLCTVPGRAVRPSFTPAGDAVYFGLEENKGEQRRLCYIKTDGTGFRRLPVEAGMQAEPALSDDGTTIVTTWPEVILYNAADGSKLLQLPNPNQFQMQNPCFSRDGKFVLASAFADGRMKLMQLFTDGSGSACLATSDRIFSPCISPDGSTILYSDEKGLRRLGADGIPAPFATGAISESVTSGMSWQAAPGRWTPDPPALKAPADKAVDVPVPAILQWKPAPGVTGYEAQLALDPKFTQPVREMPRLFGDEIAVESLQSDTTYYWRIRACFRDEKGAWSTPRAFKTGKAAITFGKVRGTVTFEGGMPLANMRVTLKIGTTSTILITREDGSFTGVVRAGAGTASTEDAGMPVTVAAGEVTEIALVQKPASGVVVTVTQPDGKPFAGSIIGASRFKEDVGGETRYNERIFTQPRNVSPGFFWFPEVRPEDTEFAVCANLRGSFINGNLIQRWTFTTREAVRRVAVTVPEPVHVTIAVKDETGKPLANARVDGSIGRWLTDSFNFWPESRRENHFVNSEITMGKPERKTDAEGVLDLDNLLPNTYYLNLTVAGRGGERAELKVNEDGTAAPNAYIVRPLRTVKQTVYRPDGKPGANADVYASFCRGSRMTVLRAQANAQGQVAWEGLPHRRVIVSGPGIAASVIPAEGTSFPQPLPAPAPGPTAKFQLQSVIHGTFPVNFGVIVQTPDSSATRHDTANLSADTTGAMLNDSWTLRTGVPFTLLWGATTIPSQTRLLDGVYLPYAEDDAALVELPVDDFPLADYPGVAVFGDALTRAGEPAVGQTLHIVPVAGNLLYEILTAGKVDWLLDVKTNAIGGFTASLPPTGGYEIRAGDKPLIRITASPKVIQQLPTLTLP